MAKGRASEILRRLRGAMLLREGADLTDGQLLECFISRRDAAAMEALVRRHGPMVWGVCRRVLHNHHDAEDAFQAAFLVLVRRAASIASRELLANWLYGVAHQTARKARATAAKRKGRERQATDLPEPAAAAREPWDDWLPLLDEELSRLPAKYRTVIVLCDLEGKTRKEAARQLGAPEGTVASRLTRARGMLGKRLARRGLTAPGGALAAALSQKAASACVPAALACSTVKAVVAAGAAGLVSAQVAALTEGVMRAMFLTKLKIAATGVFAALAAAALTYGVATCVRAGDKGGGTPAAHAGGGPDEAGGDVDDVLTVRVDPQKIRVRPNKEFDVRLRVINSSQRTQILKVYNCSWFEEWKSDNERVVMGGWDCAKNGQVTETLEAGQAYEKKASMLLLSGEPGEKVTFRMGFTSIGDKRTHWSNEVALWVEPEPAEAAKAPPPDAGPGAAAAGRDSLDGYWDIHSVNGQASPNFERPRSWEFKGDAFTLSDPYLGDPGPGKQTQGTFRLGEDATKPGKGEVAPIDLIFPVADPGVQNSKPRYVALKGVYAWDGKNRLKLCFRLSDGDRPTMIPEHKTAGLISFGLEYVGPPAKTREEVQIESLKRNFNWRFKAGLTGEAAEKSIEAMKDLVKNAAWDVKGMKVGQLEDVVGIPAVKDPSGSVSYRFDTGYGGELWVFSVEKGRVTGWVVKKLE